ncbi:MAG: hypothetical protein HYY30_07770 [Chloroflexi bacterium]|nr:hypothetical protein [Chloroflexota bacterium]
MIELLRAFLLFGLAGIAEIGGGWLIWQSSNSCIRFMS